MSVYDVAGRRVRRAFEVAVDERRVAARQLEPRLAGGPLARILGLEVPQGLVARMAEQGVVVQVHLGVDGVALALGCEDVGIDLGQAGVGRHEGLVPAAALVQLDADPESGAAQLFDVRRIDRAQLLEEPRAVLFGAFAQVFVDEDVELDAATRSRLLQAPLRDLARESEEGGPVAKSLTDLRIEVEKLDPAGVDLFASATASATPRSSSLRPRSTRSVQEAKGTAGMAQARRPSREAKSAAA